MGVTQSLSSLFNSFIHKKKKLAMCHRDRYFSIIFL